jgi:hypothetical protein
MATRHQIDKLKARIADLQLELGGPRRPTYRVFMSFDGETDEAFLGRYPDARGTDGRRLPMLILSFD